MTKTPPGNIVVIVVNYGTAALSIEAVQSVLDRSHGGRVVEVHLVDNASPGEDAAAIKIAHQDRNWGDRVQLYLETANHGFGRGNNLVFDVLAKRSVPPEKVFLLNPDATLENEALDILARQMEANPQVAFAGAAISKPGNLPVTAAFRFPTPFGEFLRGANFGPLTRMFPGRIVQLPPDHPHGPVDWVAGAAVMIRFDALQELGFFDPAYFLYYEEVDLMFRAHRAGWETWYVPEARVIHAEGQSTGVQSGQRGRPRLPAYWYDSWRMFFAGNYGPVGVRAAALAWLGGAAINHVVGRLPGRAVSVPGRFFGDLSRRVLRPLFWPGGRTDG